MNVAHFYFFDGKRMRDSHADLLGPKSLSLHWSWVASPRWEAASNTAF